MGGQDTAYGGEEIYTWSVSSAPTRYHHAASIYNSQELARITGLERDASTWEYKGKELWTTKQEIHVKNSSEAEHPQSVLATFGAEIELVNANARLKRVTVKTRNDLVFLQYVE